MSTEAVTARLKLACQLGNRVRLWRLARSAAFHQEVLNRAARERLDRKDKSSK